MNMPKVDHVEPPSKARIGLLQRPVFVVLIFGLIIITALFTVAYLGFFAR